MSVDLPPDSDSARHAQARRNASRLREVERWRHAMEADAPQVLEQVLESGVGSEPWSEPWEARAMSEVWEHARHDSALSAMLHEEERALELEDAQRGVRALDEGEMEQARAALRRKMSVARADWGLPQVLGGSAAGVPEGALTVGEVVAQMQRDAPSEILAPLEPLRESGEELPAPITAGAMRDFWKNLGLSLPREAASAFNSAARLLLMGRATPGGASLPLSLARPSSPSGISQAVAQVALESAQAADEEAPQVLAGDEPAPDAVPDAVSDAESKREEL